ncbi:MAG: AAA family ATPase [Alphaproteobacteria bacterium]
MQEISAPESLEAYEPADEPTPEQAVEQAEKAAESPLAPESPVAEVPPSEVDGAESLSDDAADGAAGAEDFEPVEVGNAGSPAAIGYVGDAESARVLAGRLEARGLSATIRPGGIHDAVGEYRNAMTPRVLFVDLSDTPDPLAEIDALAEVCEPGTIVVALGQENDVGLFRALISAGVADYLVKPLAAEAIDAALESAAEQPAAPESVEDSKVIAFIGAHGGVGATSLAVNAAWMISEEQRKQVAIVDLDLKFGSVSLTMDIEPGRGLREALQNPGRIDGLFVAGAAININDRLYVLGSEEPVEDNINFDVEALDILLRELRRNFEVVILDVPRAIAASMQPVLSDATVVVVSDMSLVGVRDTLRIVGFAKRAAAEGKVLTVINRAGADKKAQIPKAEFEKGIEAKIDITIPEDAKTMALASHSGKAVLAVAKRAKITGAIRALCKSALPGVESEKKRRSLWRRKKEK